VKGKKAKIPKGGIPSACDRVLGAAFKAFTENGYSETTTLHIATRANVSKRAIYENFGSKQAVLVACITSRAARLRLSPDLPMPSDQKMLASTLTAFGTNLMGEVCHPSVMAMFRLAITEADRSPEVARALESAGRTTTRLALADLLTHAQSRGLIVAGEPAEMARQYLALLWEDLMITLLLRLTDAPTAEEIHRRASNATAAFLTLYSREIVLFPTR
jgi:AcrR family transcriptional regulator